MLTGFLSSDDTDNSEWRTCPVSLLGVYSREDMFKQRRITGIQVLLKDVNEYINATVKCHYNLETADSRYRLNTPDRSLSDSSVGSLACTRIWKTTNDVIFISCREKIWDHMVSGL